MEKWFLDQLIIWIGSLSGGNPLLTMVLIVALAAVTGIVLAVVIRVIRALLPLLVLAGCVFLCWQMGLIGQFWQWLGMLR